MIIDRVRESESPAKVPLKRSCRDEQVVLEASSNGVDFTTSGTAFRFANQPAVEPCAGNLKPEIKNLKPET